MVRRVRCCFLAILIVPTLAVFPAQAADGGQRALSENDLASAVRETLRVGTNSVVNRLSRTNGYNADPVVHIPLPESLGYVHVALFRLGMGRLVEDVELKINRAAELAAPEIGQRFIDAIAELNIENAPALLNGPKDGATRFFETKMARPLASRIHPIIDTHLRKAGAIKAYQTMMSEYSNLPWVPDIQADITTHTVDKGIDGVFLLLAREEKAIRDNPAKRTTDVLNRVFGGAD